MLAAIAARDLPGTLLLGEPTGGKPNHTGNLGQELVLPNSRLVVSYSTKVFTFPGLNGDALEPDVALSISAADYFARHDLFLAVALGLERECACDLAAPPGPITVVNAASFRALTAVAPGALVSAFGNSAGTTAADARSIPLPRQLQDVQVALNGVAAPLVAVRPRQINFQVPRATPAGKASVRVTLAGRELAAGTVAVAAADPGLFVLEPQSWSKPGAVLNEDFRVNSESVQARRGDIVQIFGTGAGAFDPPVEDGAAPQAVAQTTLRPRVFAGAEEADVLFSGASPEFPGLWQVNARMPTKATILGQIPLFVVLGGAPSNSVTIWVAEPLP